MERTPDGAAGSAARGTLLASIVGAARLLAGSQPGAPVPGRNLPALVEILRVAAWLAVRISAPDASPTPIFSYPSSDATSDASHTLKKPVPVDVALLTARLAHAAQVVVSAERAALSATPESPVHVAFDPPEPLTVLCADPSALAFAILYVLTDAASHVRGGEVVSVRLASRRTSGRSSGSSTPCSAGGDLLQVTVTASIPSASLTIRDDVEDAGARSRKLAAAAALVAPAAIGLLSLSSSSSMSREEDEDDDSYPATGEARMTLFATLPPKIHRPELHPRAHTEHIHPPAGLSTSSPAPLSAPATSTHTAESHAEHDNKVTLPSRANPSVPGLPHARPTRPARTVPVASTAPAAAVTGPSVAPGSTASHLQHDPERVPEVQRLSPRCPLPHTPRSGPATPLREAMDYFSPILADKKRKKPGTPLAGVGLSNTTLATIPTDVPEEVARAGLVVQDPQGRPAGLFFSPGHVAADVGTSPQPPPSPLDPLLASSSSGAPFADATEAEPPHDPTDPEVTPAKPEREKTLVPPKPGTTESAAATLVQQAQAGGLPAVGGKTREVPKLDTAAQSRSIPTAVPVVSHGAEPITKATAAPAGTYSALAPPSMEAEGSSTPIAKPEAKTKTKTKTKTKAKTKKPKDKEKKPDDKKSKVILPPIKVLLVEDNKINVQILTRLLTRNQIQFDVAKNGMEAIAKWRDGSFHIIFMDIQLPVLDGIVATKVIRRQEKISGIGKYPSPGTHTARDLPPLDGEKEGCDPDLLAQALATAAGTEAGGEAKTPASAKGGEYRPAVIIVALTASSFDSDRVAALAAGCNDFLNKPVDHKWLERKISEWGSMQYLLLAGLSRHPPAPPPSHHHPSKKERPRISAGRDRMARVRDLERAQVRQAGLLAERMHMPPHRIHRTESPAPGEGHEGTTAASSAHNPASEPSISTTDRTMTPAVVDASADEASAALPASETEGTATPVAVIASAEKPSEPHPLTDAERAPEGQTEEG